MGAGFRVARGRNRRRVSAGSGRKLARRVAAVALATSCASVGLVGWRAVCRAQALRIRAIRFEGLRHATADELLARSPVKPGDHLLLADIGAMKQALSGHPWVLRVEVHRRWPPSLSVSISERTAQALVALSGLYLVDEESNIFKRAEAGDGLDLPLITGLARTDYVEHRDAIEPLLAGALALGRTWRERGLDGIARLSEIHVDPVGGTTIYVGEEGTQVRLGMGDLPAKLSRLEKLLSAFHAEGKRVEVLHLDNRLHPSWVAVRFARQSGAGFASDRPNELEQAEDQGGLTTGQPHFNKPDGVGPRGP